MTTLIGFEEFNELGTGLCDFQDTEVVFDVQGKKGSLSCTDPLEQRNEQQRLEDHQDCIIEDN